MSHQVDLPGDPPRQGALEAADGRSIGEVMGDLTKDVSTLMQQEVALAKAELRQSGQRAGKGIGLFAGAAVAGLLFLVFLSVSAWWGLGQFIGQRVVRARRGRRLGRDRDHPGRGRAGSR